MPIRLNLLAEAQAAEEARRRDPVKRAMWAAALLLVAILVWSSSLQVKVMLVHSELGHLDSQINARTNEYRSILEAQNKSADIKHRLDSLRSLTDNRLLQGTLLNAMQKTTVDDVQLVRLRIEQTYAVFEGSKAHTNDTGMLIPGKPPTSTEKTLLTLEGTDSSANPGDQLTKYKDALAANPYFKQMLLKTNGISLKNLAPPQVSPMTGKRSVVFTLECRYPDKTR